MPNKFATTVPRGKKYSESDLTGFVDVLKMRKGLINRNSTKLGKYKDSIEPSIY